MRSMQEQKNKIVTTGLARDMGDAATRTGRQLSMWWQKSSKVGEPDKSSRERDGPDTNKQRRTWKMGRRKGKDRNHRRADNSCGGKGEQKKHCHHWRNFVATFTTT